MSMKYTKQIGNCPREGCGEAIICCYLGDEAYIIDHDRACTRKPIKKDTTDD